MIYRYMRMIIFFDLPVETATEKSAYRHFVKAIKSDGFVMMQKSVYTKLLVNNHSINQERKNIMKVVPKNGIVSILTITEKQFQTIENLIGEFSNLVLTTDERYVEL